MRFHARSIRRTKFWGISKWISGIYPPWYFTSEQQSSGHKLLSFNYIIEHFICRLDKYPNNTSKGSRFLWFLLCIQHSRYVIIKFWVLNIHFNRANWIRHNPRTWIALQYIYSAAHKLRYWKLRYRFYFPASCIIHYESWWPHDGELLSLRFGDIR